MNRKIESNPLIYQPSTLSGWQLRSKINIQSMPKMKKKLIIFILTTISFLSITVSAAAHEPNIEKKLEQNSPSSTHFCQSSPQETARQIIAPFINEQKNIKEWRTPEGSRVIFLSTPKTQVVDINLSFAGGSALDNFDTNQTNKAGLTGLMIKMMFSGGISAAHSQPAYSAEEWLKREAALNGFIVGRENYDSISFHLHSIAEKPYLDKTVDLLSDVLQRPAFDLNKFKQVRSDWQDALQRSEPKNQLQPRVIETLYGSHPYGLRTTVDTLAAININDLKIRRQKVLGLDRAIFTIIGDLSEEQGKQIVQQLSAHLPKKSLMPDVPEVKHFSASTQIEIRDNQQQSQVIIATPGIKRTDKDYDAFSLASEILGGRSLDSHLIKTMRDKKGLVYGAYTFEMPLLQRGIFGIRFATNIKQQKAATELALAELKKFVTNGPSQAELDTTRCAMMNRYALPMSNVANLIGPLSELAFYNLPLNYAFEWPTVLASLTIENVRSVLKKHIDLNHIVVGAIISKAGPEVDLKPSSID